MTVEKVNCDASDVGDKANLFEEKKKKRVHELVVTLYKGHFLDNKENPSWKLGKGKKSHAKTSFCDPRHKTRSSGFRALSTHTHKKRTTFSTVCGDQKKGKPVWGRFRQLPE